MAYVKLEFSNALHYKERTHSDESVRGFLGRSYRWDKRQAGKIARRNADVIIAEHLDDSGPDLELVERMAFWLAWLSVVDRWYFYSYYRNTDCHICGLPGGH